MAMSLEDSSHSSYVGKLQRQVTTVTSVIMFDITKSQFHWVDLLESFFELS